jgi:hypothetical protein
MLFLRVLCNPTSASRMNTVINDWFLIKWGKLLITGERVLAQHDYAS